MTEAADPAREQGPKPVWSPYRRDCASRALLDTIGDKWTILILTTLGRGEVRYSQIEKAVAGISQKMLSARLSTLVADGLVIRTAFVETPPRVTYQLSPLGRSALPMLHALVDWTVDHMTAVAEHRASAARRPRPRH